IAKEKMYLTSGHLPVLYSASMFPPMELREREAEEKVEANKQKLQKAEQRFSEVVKKGSEEEQFFKGQDYLQQHARLEREIKELRELSSLQPERYYLKAMNCPHHHRIFAAQPRSYRDLPLRLAEYGTNYRYE